MSSICWKAMSSGDVVIEYKPLVHCIGDEYKGKVCDNCLKAIKGLKRCVKCRQMFYCDISCQQMDWIYHKNECHVFTNRRFDTKYVTDFEKLCLRLCLRIRSDETFVEQKYKCFDGSDISLNDIEVKVEELTKNDKHLQLFETFADLLSNIGVKFAHKELIHWFGIVCQRLTLIYDSDNNIIFNAYYIQTSRLSHSCVPNSALINNGLSLELRVMKSIGLGEEITISGISDLALNKTDRQMKLKERLIDCKCEKCERNLDSDIDYPLFRKLKEQIFNTKSIDDMNSFDSSVNQFLSIGTAVYGEYYPQITVYLFQILGLYFKTSEPNRDLVKELIKRFRAYITVTHGDSHPLNRVFNRDLIEYYIKHNLI